MKKLYTLYMILMLTLAPIVYAEEDSADAGTKPGDAFYGLDKAMDSLSLAFTFGNDAKAKKELEIAKERLAELKSLSEEGKAEEAREAKEEHEKLLVKVKTRIDKIEEDDSLEQYEKELEFEAKIREQKEQALKIEIKGDLPEEARSQLEALIASLGEDVEELEIKIKTKQEETKIKVKSDHSEEELEELEGPYWQKKAENEQIRAEEEIVKSTEKISRFEDRYLNFEEKPEVPDDNNETEEENEEEREDDDSSSSSGSKNPEMNNQITGQVTGEEQNSNELDAGKQGSNDSDDEIECSVDADCSDSEYCKSGECEDLHDETDDIQCTVDSDCNSGEFCDDNECEDLEDNEYEMEEEYDDNILDEFGLYLPEYEEKNIESSKQYLEDAKEALESSKSKEDFKEAYAYARFAKKLAQKAGSGKYLDLNDAQEQAYEAQKEEQKRVEEEIKEREEQLEDEEKEREEAEKEERERLEDEEKEAEDAAKEEEKRLEDEEKEERDDDKDSEDDEEDNSGSN